MIRVRQYEQGATALLVVVFSVLLLVTVTVGFMRLVVQDQIRSADDELSRGAYDSALAGVEDGKRVLQAGTPEAQEAINAGKCNTIHTAKILSSTDGSHNNDEVKLQTSSGTDGGFEQAYTCVTITRDTDDYLGSLEADMSRIIPLTTTGQVSRIKFSWFKSAGLGQQVAPRSGPQVLLPPLGSWSTGNTATPPLMRLQLITFKNSGGELSEFDSGTGGSTVYLYPSESGTGDEVSFSGTDSRSGSIANPVRVRCTKTGQYSCSATLSLPVTIGPGANDYGGYLRVTSLYAASDFSVMPAQEGVQFRDVQPIIDSTGRASNIFRRVAARVERINSGDGQLYPRATVDITKSFCKAFGVTDTSITESTDCHADGP